MKHLYTYLLCLLGVVAYAQSDTTVSTDILRAPISPAFQLLGNNPTEIERPTTPTDFVASLTQSTNNFTTIPANISFVLSPKWLFDTKENRNNFENFKRNSSVGNNIVQSFVISMGTATYKYDSTIIRYNTEKYNSNVTQHTSAAFGFKFSPWRGEVDKKSIANSESLKKADAFLFNYAKVRQDSIFGDKNYQLLAGQDTTNPQQQNLLNDTIKQLSAKILSELQSLASLKKAADDLNAKPKDKASKNKLTLLNDTINGLTILLAADTLKIQTLRSTVSNLQAQRKDIRRRMKEIENSWDNLIQSPSNLRKQIDSVKQLFISGEQEIKRYGFKVDIAAGFVLDFPTQKLSFSKITKVSVWATGGWDDKRNWGFLGMFRFSYNPNLIYKDNLDTLNQLNKWTFDLGSKFYLASVKKLTLSAEIIGRWYINANAQSVVKYSITADYEVAKNKYISLTVGKDFQGPTKTGGNLFAALNTTIGIGSIRPLFDRN